MRLKLLKMGFILLSLSVSTVHATTTQEEIPCAPVDAIQQSVQKLDTALKMGDAYITYTATPVFHINDLWWFIGVGNITADSTDEAITIGKSFLTNATIQVDKYATKVGNEYICNYGPGYIQARGKVL